MNRIRNSFQRFNTYVRGRNVNTEAENGRVNENIDDQDGAGQLTKRNKKTKPNKTNRRFSRKNKVGKT